MLEKKNLTENMKDSQSRNNAYQTIKILHIFYDISIKAIEKGIRPNTHFDKAEWKYVINCFKEQINHALTKHN